MEEEDPWCRLLLPLLSLLLWRLELLPGTLLRREDEEAAAPTATWDRWLWPWAWRGLKLPAPLAEGAPPVARDPRSEVVLAVRPWCAWWWCRCSEELPLPERRAALGSEIRPRLRSRCVADAVADFSGRWFSTCRWGRSPAFAEATKKEKHMSKPAHSTPRV